MMKCKQSRNRSLS